MGDTAGSEYSFNLFSSSSSTAIATIQRIPPPSMHRMLTGRPEFTFSGLAVTMSQTSFVSSLGVAAYPNIHLIVDIRRKPALMLNEIRREILCSAAGADGLDGDFFRKNHIYEVMSWIISL